MTTLPGYDAWKTTPPDDTDNEHAEDDALERDHNEHMQLLRDWLEQSNATQLRIGSQLMLGEIDARKRRYEDELRELNRERAKRRDAGKPRTKKEEAP